MKKYNVGILGASGAVGREMIKVLEERNFPINTLKLFASERSVGKKVEFCGKEIAIELAELGAFKGLDFVLGAASNAVGRQGSPRSMFLTYQVFPCRRHRAHPRCQTPLS